MCHRFQLRVVISFISVKMKWKMSFENIKNSLNFISLPIKYLPILHLFFSWKCPLHPRSYSISVNNLPFLQILWQVWAPPCSLCNNYAVTTYSNKPDDSQRKVIIDSSSYPASLKNHNLCITQGSFQVVTHCTYTSVTAWLLETKALKACWENPRSFPQKMPFISKCYIFRPTW